MLYAILSQTEKVRDWFVILKEAKKCPIVVDNFEDVGLCSGLPFRQHVIELCFWVKRLINEVRFDICKHTW